MGLTGALRLCSLFAFLCANVRSRVLLGSPGCGENNRVEQLGSAREAAGHRGRPAGAQGDLTEILTQLTPSSHLTEAETRPVRSAPVQGPKQAAAQPGLPCPFTSTLCRGLAGAGQGTDPWSFRRPTLGGLGKDPWALFPEPRAPSQRALLSAHHILSRAPRLLLTVRGGGGASYTQTHQLWQVPFQKGSGGSLGDSGAPGPCLQTSPCEGAGRHWVCEALPGGVGHTGCPPRPRYTGCSSEPGGPHETSTFTPCQRLPHHGPGVLAAH